MFSREQPSTGFPLEGDPDDVERILAEAEAGRKDVVADAKTVQSEQGSEEGPVADVGPVHVGEARQEENEGDLVDAVVVGNEVAEGSADAREAQELEEMKGAGVLAMLGDSLQELWKKVRESHPREALGNIAEKIKLNDLVEILKNKKIFGRSAWTFLGGMATGTAVRFGVRAALGTVTGGTGYIFAGASGAISGAAIQGIKTYQKELERIISEEEFRGKIQEQEEGKEDLENKLSRYLALQSREDEAGFEGERKELYRELKQELALNSVRWRQVMRGALVGAAVGAVGGIVGNYLASVVEHYFMPDEARHLVQGEAGEAARVAKDAGKEAQEQVIKEKIESAAREAYNRAYEEAVTGGTNELHAHTFSITAEKGEGLTHIARKLVHDFLVEQKDLGGEAGLSKAQIVYAEDLLRRQLEGTVEPGETFQIGGAQIAGVVERAKNLTELQVKNIETRWVPRIDGSTWKKILDYSTNYGKENNVSDAVIQRAKEAATAKAQAAAEEAGRALSEAPPVVSPQAVLAKDAWFKGVWVAYLGAGMVAGGVGALGYKYRGVLKEKVARTIERLEKNLFAEDSGVEIEKEVESGALENDVSPEREEGEGAVPKETVPKDTAKGKKGFFARKAEEKRAAEEVRRTREREKEESRRASEREKEEAEKRFAVDPLVRFLASKGKKVTLGEVTYRGLVPEDIGKEQAGNVSFEDYSTFRRYVDGLTLWQRVKMRMYHDHEHNRSFGIFAPPEFWGELKKDPELEREFFEVQDRALRGLLPDEYGGIPANKEVTKETVDALRSSISEEFRKETGSRRSLSVYASNLSVFPEETYEGLLKLREALKDIPKDVQISLVEEASGIVSLGRENRLDGWGSIEIQPGLTVQEMVVFLKKVIPESVRRRKEALERDRAKL